LQSELQIFKAERLDTISSTFCAAKWFQAEVYLHTGVTSSCHFPSPHHINFDKVKENNLLLHNTEIKFEERNAMLSNIQPSVCSNCWNVENIDNNAMSHRVWYSKRHHNNNFEQLSATSVVVPELIDVVFDTYCNLSCVYCDPSQSSAWASDIKKNGNYNLQLDSRNTYDINIINNVLPEKKYSWLYNQFVNMVTENISKIKTINILGGEPLMSPNIWNFLDTLVKHNTRNLVLGITTNLSQFKLIKRFLTYDKYFKHLKISISIDGTHNKAEFIRNGLQWNEFLKGVNYVLSKPTIDIWFLGTINMLSIDGLTDVLTWHKNITKKYSRNIPYKIYNCRWPNFQVIQLLPRYIKTQYINDINNWIKKNKITDLIMIAELDQLKLLLMREEEISNEIFTLRQDAKYFIIEFAKRNNLDIANTFSKSLATWILKE